MSDGLNVNTGTAVALSISATLFPALMPAVSDLWVTKPGTVTANMVRSAEILAGGISLSIALVISAMVDSLTPFILTSIVSASIALAYEVILRKDILNVY